MSLNIENIGEPFVMIDSKKKNNKKIIYINDKKDGGMYNFTELKLNDGDKFQLIPNTKKERIINYIFGQSGSGKSYWITEFCKQYKKIYQSNPIYLFSSLDNDETIDKLNAKRINLNDDFLNTDLTMEDFQNSMLIFDDCDCIKDKKIKNKVFSILNSVLETGRHKNISVCFVSHVGTKGAETKTILNECHNLVMFPKTMGNASLKYILDAYGGLDKNEINYIKTMDSRWVCICKTYPKVIVSEKEIFIPSAR
jgi:hypothetical protein